MSEHDRFALSAAGELLFGPRWQSETARLLGVGGRRVREWVAGDRSIPPGVWPELAAALRRRSDQAMALAESLHSDSSR